MLPRVKIDFDNGALGSVIPNADNVVGLAITGVSTDKFQTGTTYVLRSLDQLAPLGITAVPEDANAFIYRHVKDFYAEAGNGSELWLMAFPNNVKQSDIVDRTQAYGQTLINAAAGRLKALIIAYLPTPWEAQNTNGDLDDDLQMALQNAQAMAENETETKFAPLFIVLEGRTSLSEINPINLLDLTSYQYDRVGVLLGRASSDSIEPVFDHMDLYSPNNQLLQGSAMGLLAGRIARIPVQRNIGRVKDGAVKTLKTYIATKPIEQVDVESIHDKGYITFRTFVGRAGYYFSDDSLATQVADDYRSIARRRTIDKAYRIAYSTLITELLDEIPISDEGKLIPAMVKAWEMNVETAIMSQMTAEGNLGVDPTNDNDTGVQCTIDYNQNVIATGRIEVILRVKPYGYAKYIDVKLGFKTLAN